MAFATVEQLRARLASAMRVAADDASVDASSPWQVFLEDAVDDAYQDILGELSARGFTVAQVGTWVRRVQFNLDIGLYWVLTKGASLQAFDEKFVNKLDRRAELADVVLLDEAGNRLEPASEGSTIVGQGDLRNESDLYKDYETGEWRQF